MTITTVTNDILNAYGCYVAHQCNCVSVQSAGLAKTLFMRYPGSNDYQRLDIVRIPGTVKIYPTNYKIGPIGIINMYSQVFPGKSNTTNQTNMRSALFEQCLAQIADLFPPEKSVSIAFPYKIGCGLAGGDWKTYLKMLQTFDESHSNITVLIFKRESDN